MILSVLRLISLPHRTSELLQGLRFIMRAARAEKGLISCRLAVGSDDPNTIDYEERWSTAEDLEQQLRSTRYARLLTLMESAAERPTLEFHFVAETRGLEYVAAVLGEKWSPGNGNSMNTTQSNHV